MDGKYCFGLVSVCNIRTSPSVPKRIKCSVAKDASFSFQSSSSVREVWIIPRLAIDRGGIGHEETDQSRGFIITHRQLVQRILQTSQDDELEVLLKFFATTESQSNGLIAQITSKQADEFISAPNTESVGVLELSSKTIRPAGRGDNHKTARGI
jgi:hypothetical protein